LSFSGKLANVHASGAYIIYLHLQIMLQMYIFSLNQPNGFISVIRII